MAGGQMDGRTDWRTDAGQDISTAELKALSCAKKVLQAYIWRSFKFVKNSQKSWIHVRCSIWFYTPILKSQFSTKPWTKQGLYTCCDQSAILNHSHNVKILISSSTYFRNLAGQIWWKSIIFRQILVLVYDSNKLASQIDGWTDNQKTQSLWPTPLMGEA